MTRPTRRKESRSLQYRARVPADIADKARSLTLTIALPEDADHKAVAAPVRVAKSRTRAIEEQLSRTWEAIRVGPLTLTRKEVVALAGKVYRAFAEAFEDEPGSPARWRKVLADSTEAMRGDWTKYSRAIPTSDSAQERVLTSLNLRFGDITDSVLSSEGLAVAPEARNALLLEVGKALQEASEKLKRNTEGDYSPDPKAARYPEWKGAKSAKPVGRVTLSSLFEGWKAEAEKRRMRPASHRGTSSATRTIASGRYPSRP